MGEYTWCKRAFQRIRKRDDSDHEMIDFYMDSDLAEVLQALPSFGKATVQDKRPQRDE